MQRIWLIRSEILVEPGDLPSGCTKAIVNVTTWAESAKGAREKLSRYLESFRWHLISVEETHPISESEKYDEEVEDMIEKTRSNTAAIILGRFFSYKEE
jgi:hypothetical protein